MTFWKINVVRKKMIKVRPLTTVETRRNKPVVLNDIKPLWFAPCNTRPPVANVR